MDRLEDNANVMQREGRSMQDSQVGQLKLETDVRAVADRIQIGRLDMAEEGRWNIGWGGGEGGCKESNNYCIIWPSVEWQV